MTIINLISNSGSGYYIGLGIEAVVALVAGVLLVLLLANVFVKREQKQSEPETALAQVETQKETWVVEEGEPVVTVADEPPVEIIREINTVYVPVQMETAPVQQEEVAPVPTEESEPVKADEPVSTEKADPQPIIINVFNGSSNTTATATEPPKEEEPAVAPQEETGKDEVKFSESKSIEESYEELSVEQKSFFDELKNTALAKPNAVLSITKNYENIKIGKRSIIKLLIRRGVTVAEFVLENDALKEYRLSSQNKKGKSKIKIRPTVLAVTELDTLKAAVDMIHLSYEQIIGDSI